MNTARDDQSQTRRVAAIQMHAVVGDAAPNIAHAEQRIEEAFQAGAQIVALPEFFTGAIAPRAQTADCVLPARNAAIDMMSRLAARHGGWVGGSMLVEQDGEIYNRYVLVGPKGEKHAHDKDLPTMWERAFYRGGSDDGVWQTELGGVGAAVCWELIRSQTVKRMRGRVELAMTGTHWWTLPHNWPGAMRRMLASIGQYNRYLSEQAPVEFARRLGAPVVQASHCGQIGGQFRLGLGWQVPYETEYVGASQIVDSRGQVLASRNVMEGPGTVYADVALGAQTPVCEDALERFWIPHLPLFLKAYWHQQNWVSEMVYRKTARAAGVEAARRAAQGES